MEHISNLFTCRLHRFVDILISVSSVTMTYVCLSDEAALNNVQKTQYNSAFIFYYVKFFTLASRKTFPEDGKLCWNMELTPPDTSSRIQYSANSTKCSETDIGRGGGGRGKLGGGGGETAEK